MGNESTARDVLISARKTYTKMTAGVMDNIRNGSLIDSVFALSELASWLKQYEWDCICNAFSSDKITKKTRLRFATDAIESKIAVGLATSEIILARIIIARTEGGIWETRYSEFINDDSE